jgi:hypothetical protein
VDTSEVRKREGWGDSLCVCESEWRGGGNQRREARWCEGEAKEEEMCAEVCLNIYVLKYLTLGSEISSFLTSMWRAERACMRVGEMYLWSQQWRREARPSSAIPVCDFNQSMRLVCVLYCVYFAGANRVCICTISQLLHSAEQTL